MKRLTKLFLALIIAVVGIFALNSCKKNNSTYNYPSEYPHLSATAKDAFLKVGNFTVTNEMAYTELLNSYGYEELMDIIDEKLLKDVVLDEDTQKILDEQLNTTIYGTNDVDSLNAAEKQEKEDAYKLVCEQSGLHFTKESENDPLYYYNYYLLQYKRYAKALEVLKNEVAEYDKAQAEKGEGLRFSDDDYKSYFSAYYHKTYEAIVVTFSSQAEALAALSSQGVDIEKLNEGFDDPEAVFTALYQAAYGKACPGAQQYTYKDLTTIQATTTTDGTIAAKASTLKAGEYTKAPLAFGSRWYMIYMKSTSNDYFNIDDDTDKVADSEDNFVKNNKGNVTALTDSLKAKLYNKLVLNLLVNDATYAANYIDKTMFELRQDAGLEIFDEGLEITYKTAFDKVYANLEITDYTSFKETANVSSSVVAKTSSFEITVEDFFKRLSDHYGALLSLLFLQQYFVLNSKYNTVVNYSTGEVLDQEKYDEYLKTDLTTYKDSFLNGEFESNGYPTAYGWENFLRDYLGILDEKYAVIDFNSSLYNDVLDEMVKDLYLATAEDVTVELDNGEYVLKSAKWQNTYHTGLMATDTDGLPTVKFAYTEEDIAALPTKDSQDKDITYEKNDYYGHILLTYSKDGASKTILTDVCADQAVLEKYDEIYNETFSAKVSGIYAFYDCDNDGVADDISEDDDAKLLAAALVDELWADINARVDFQNTLADAMSFMLREFTTSTTKYLAYKQAGLKVMMLTNSTYSNSSTADEKFLAAVKEGWNYIIDYEVAGEKVSSVAGQSLDPVYRYIKNNVVYTVTTKDVDVANTFLGDDNCTYHVVVTTATSKTAYEYTSGTKTQKPSLYIYEQYQLASADREITISCSTQITTYYTPAINKLTATTTVNKFLMQGCKDLIASSTFNGDQAKVAQVLTDIINGSMAE